MSDSSCGAFIMTALERVASHSDSARNNEPLMSHAATAARLNYQATTNTDLKRCGLMIPERSDASLAAAPAAFERRPPPTLLINSTALPQRPDAAGSARCI